jgi:hypothetical protein
MSDKVFRFDIKGIKTVDKKMADALAKATYELQDEIREAQVIPRAEGTLQGTGFTISDHAKEGYMDMGFSTPYARRLYFHPEYHFRTDENPHAKGEWMEDWIEGGKDEGRLAEIFEGILNL